MDTRDQDTDKTGQDETRVSPGGSGCSCGSGQSVAPLSYVYALGRIRMRFPTLAVEKEFAQTLARVDCAGLTDWQATHSVLSRPENRYLVRKVCWILSVEGLDTYLLVPRDPVDVGMLVDALRREPDHGDVDVVIGVRGPIAPTEMCNGLQIPIVIFDQVYSFDVDTLVSAIPRPEPIPAERFAADARELFSRIMQLADNAGSADEHRALNYLAVRYSAIYATSAEAHGRNAALTSVDVRTSRLSGVRKVVDVIFSFTNRTTDVTDKYFVRVDVTEEFPFLISKMSPYYDR
jgi:hypothetical protein